MELMTLAPRDSLSLGQGTAIGSRRGEEDYDRIIIILKIINSNC
jgi:hypothetical protein